MGRLASYFRPWLKRFTIIVISVTLLSAAQAGVPILAARGVEMLAGDAQGADVSQFLLYVLVGALIVLGVAVWGINWVRRLLTSMLIGDVVLALRKDAFRAAMNHDLSFYDKYQSGRIVSRITTDSDEFGRVSVLVTDVFSQLLLSVVLFVVLVSIEWRLALLVLGMAPVALFVANLFRGIARNITQQSQRVIAEVNVSIQGAVTGINVAKNFRREQGIFDEFRDVKRAGLRHPGFAWRGVGAGLPHVAVLQRAGDCRAALHRRLQRFAGNHQRGVVVSLHQQPGSLLVPHDPAFGVLEPISGRSQRHGTYLRADRRLAGGDPAGREPRGQAERRDRICRRELPLQRQGAGAQPLRSAHPAR
ncbi:MAG: ABC transporter ATP-binding protein [Caldilineaceae bacterium]